MANYQGGKAFGKLRQQQENTLDEVNKSFFEDHVDEEEDYPDLEQRLQAYKKQFMEYDEDNSGDIDLMELKMMMEKLGQAKTHLELKKMITEVDTRDSGTIDYNDFLSMMLGKKSTILKLILMFEEKKKGKQRPTGLPPKRDLSSLP